MVSLTGSQLAAGRLFVYGIAVIEGAAGGSAVVQVSVLVCINVGIFLIVIAVIFTGGPEIAVSIYLIIANGRVKLIGVEIQVAAGVIVPDIIAIHLLQQVKFIYLRIQTYLEQQAHRIFRAGGL